MKIPPSVDRGFLFCSGFLHECPIPHTTSFLTRLRYSSSPSDVSERETVHAIAEAVVSGFAELPGFVWAENLLGARLVQIQVNLHLFWLIFEQALQGARSDSNDLGSHDVMIVLEVYVGLRARERRGPIMRELPVRAKVIQSPANEAENAVGRSG